MQRFHREHLTLVDDEESLSSSDDSAQSPRENTTSQDAETAPISITTATRPHVSVQRSEISSTRVQEANDELEELDVEVYDRQTYEDEVFSQVSRAISAAEASTSSRPFEGPSGTTSEPQHHSNNHITHLMQVIHSQEEETNLAEDQNNGQDKDERLIQLTRLERLNRQQVKKESQPPTQAPPTQPVNNYTIPKKTSSLQEKRKPAREEEVHLQQCQVPVIYTPNPPFQFDTPNKVKRKTATLESDSEHDASKDSDFQPSQDDSDNQESDVDIDYISDESQSKEPSDETESKRGLRRRTLEDDGDIKVYQKRMKAYTKARAKIRFDSINAGRGDPQLDELVQIEENLQVPKQLWENLFEHQKTGVRWMWELHLLGTGGILGDEMGLGKTIQMIAFLTALRNSDIPNAHGGFKNLGPVILVCPTTVMHQWLSEFRTWWAPFRVAILHGTGNFSGDKRRLVQIINDSNGILIVSYQGVVFYQDVLHDFDWHYAVLDEGHKIRNPDAQVTLACKRFRTPHRIILSGSPIQNNLKELWSVFDFIYPGKLGTLPVFMAQFAIPITQGGYANATDIQVQIAYKCSCVLRDTIKPYLLRRTKAEVNHKLKLPERSEQVLFCKLTEKQRRMYQAYLDSPIIKDIKRGLCQIFVGLTQLRKICNHPDLFDSTDCQNQLKSAQQKYLKKHTEFFSEDETFGHHKKSGKMMVVDALLKLWYKQNQKVLLFSQSRQMLRIFSKFLDERNYKHLSMDGSTPIGARQIMIDEFNKKDDIFIFLLTTRVGGVGINLTGANRILIYDPDWNPSTDIQARERAWRIGQQRHVIIYRLLTAGTIEEKIYHRQVFKLYLTNRILKDAKQKRFFKTNDLHELFRLGDDGTNLETKALFEDDLQIDLKEIKKSKHKSKKKRKKRKTSDITTDIPIPEERIQQMRLQAKRLSQMISTTYGTGAASSSNSNLNQIQEVTNLDIPESNHNQSSAAPDPPQLHQKILPKPNNNIPSGAKDKRDTCTLQKVDYLVNQTVYMPDSSDKSKKDKRYKRDDYILERLFKNSSIFGALKHDKIESDSTSDFKVVESEAEKVARDAIRALRESRRTCFGSSAGVPTWTGRNGQLADRPRLMARNKGIMPTFNSQQKPSSSTNDTSVLSSIKKRTQKNPVDLIETTFGFSSSSVAEARDKDFEGKAKETGAETMADKLREYLMYKTAKPCEAQTDDLLEFFKQNFKPDTAAIFKALLYKLCTFTRRNDKGLFVLKSEFRIL